MTLPEVRFVESTYVEKVPAWLEHYLLPLADSGKAGHYGELSRSAWFEILPKDRTFYPELIGVERVYIIFEETKENVSS